MQRRCGQGAVACCCKTADAARALLDRRARKKVKLIWRHVIEAVHAAQRCEGRQAAKARMLVDPLFHGKTVTSGDKLSGMELACFSGSVELFFAETKRI